MLREKAFGPRATLLVLFGHFTRTYIIVTKHLSHAISKLNIAQQSNLVKGSLTNPNHINPVAMHVRIGLVVPSLVASVLAGPHTLEGSFSRFIAEDMKPENATVENLYNGCANFDQDDKPVSTSGNCVAALLRDTFSVLLASPPENPVDVVHNDTVLDPQLSGESSPTVATDTNPSGTMTNIDSRAAQSVATDTTSPPQSAGASATSSPHPSSPEAYDAKSRRGDEPANSLLLESINNRLSHQLGGGHAIRAVQIGESDLHPRDGIAIRTNIHGDDATLHVHTNGSHATAEFRKDDSTHMQRRDANANKASSYRFSEGAFGIKMQVTKGNTAGLSLSDVDRYWGAFAYGNGEDLPALRESDAWKFAVCDKSGWTQLAGKVIALENPSDYQYEPYNEFIACK